MWAMSIHACELHACELAMDFSQSLANLRQRLSHAKVRSTTHPLHGSGLLANHESGRGITSKPSAVSERLTISIVQSPMPSRAPRSFGPAYPPSLARQAMLASLRGGKDMAQGWIGMADGFQHFRSAVRCPAGEWHIHREGRS